VTVTYDPQYVLSADYDRSPVTDIRNSQRIESVWAAGRRVDSGRRLVLFLSHTSCEKNNR
jgi:hypothetical protein